MGERVEFRPNYFLKDSGLNVFHAVLITVLCEGRIIELCNIEIVLIFVLVFLRESQIRSTFFSGSRASPRVKIKKSLHLQKNEIQTNQKLYFLK